MTKAKAVVKPTPEAEKPAEAAPVKLTDTEKIDVILEAQTELVKTLSALTKSFSDYVEKYRIQQKAGKF